LPVHSSTGKFAKIAPAFDASMLRMKNPVLQRIWAIITWRWRMQIALNAPFALLWIADKTNPTVHAFNMSALSSLHAEWLAPMIGIA
tara:strand:- start:1146 stop:1406 length:261 start_codon:yes stop_codon:yes gene_type:complete